VTSLASGQQAIPPKPRAEPGLTANVTNEFQPDLKNVAVGVTEFQKTSAVESLLKKIDMPSGVTATGKIKNPREELTLSRIQKDKANKWHFRFNQTYKGIPVKGGVVSFHEDESNPYADPIFHGNYLEDAEVDTTPKISKQEAIAVVETMVRGKVQTQASASSASTQEPNKALIVNDNSASSSSTAVLEIHPGTGPGKRVLTYHVTSRNMSGSEPIIMEAWVDNNGKIIESYNNVQHACQDGSGRTLYQGTASYFNIAFWPAANQYVLNDNCMRIGTYDMYNTTETTYQASSFTTTFGDYAVADRNSSNADLHYSTLQTYSFMYWILGRDFIDGSGGPRVFSSVDGLGPLVSGRNHYGTKYNNAFWDPDKHYISLGDGDGSLFQSFATLDIIGHEWTHGLTQYVAGLNYVGESGAMNESISDIFGAMTERYWHGESTNTWKIGEDAFTPNIVGDAMRYMNRPTLDGSSRDHYSQRYVGTLDNGGVHWNSGISNNAFYLLANGGCHRFAGCMSGAIGANAATQIYWRALNYYMLPNDGFSSARQTTLWAAEDLYGKYSFNWYRTQEAWDLVGVPKIID